MSLLLPLHPWSCRPGTESRVSCRGAEPSLTSCSPRHRGGCLHCLASLEPAEEPAWARCLVVPLGWPGEEGGFRCRVGVAPPPSSFPVLSRRPLGRKWRSAWLIGASRRQGHLGWEECSLAPCLARSSDALASLLARLSRPRPCTILERPSGRTFRSSSSSAPGYPSPPWPKAPLPPSLQKQRNSSSLKRGETP